MTTQQIIGLIIIGTTFLAVVLFFYLSRKTFKAIVDDTLKKDGKYSATYLTMFSAWAVSLFAFVVDTVKHGGEVNEVMFGLMISVALGSKLTNSWGKKIEQPDQPSSSNDTNITVK